MPKDHRWLGDASVQASIATLRCFIWGYLGYQTGAGEFTATTLWLLVILHCVIDLFFWGVYLWFDFQEWRASRRAD